MDAKQDREWQKRIREVGYQIEDAKRFRRLYVLTVLALVVFAAVGITLACVINPAFLWTVLFDFWGTVGVVWWGQTDTPFADVRTWQRKQEELREAYAYAMMEGE